MSTRVSSVNFRLKNIRRVIFYVFCLGLGLVVISPLFYTLSVSLMSPAEASMVPPRFFPHGFNFSNYLSVLNAVPIFSFMLNSFIMCAIVVTVQILTCSCAAYAFSFFEFPFKRLCFVLVLSTMLIPVDAIIIANFLTISSLRLNDTMLALVAPSLTSAMGIFLMRQYYMTVPKELKEASIMDGCGDVFFLIRILTPISKSVIASLSIYVFINTYNQFFWPLLVTNSPQMRTVQIAMSMLRAAEAVNYNNVLAGAIIVVVPSIVIFTIGQDYMIRGMVDGAVKG